jgi:hypothetical protein
LAGLLIAAHVPELGNDFSGFPEVPLMRVGWPDPGVSIPVIGHDWAAFFDRACAWLAERGRRRVALTQATPGFETEIASAIARHGLNTRPQWTVPVHVHHRASASTIAQLLLDRPDGERPDALIVAGDNLIAPALQGVLARGLSVPRDLDTVVHCNWPTESEPILPVRQLGFDAAAAPAATINLNSPSYTYTSIAAPTSGNVLRLTGSTPDLGAGTSAGAITWQPNPISLPAGNYTVSFDVFAVDAFDRLAMEFQTNAGPNDNSDFDIGPN